MLTFVLRARWACVICMLAVAVLGTAALAGEFGATFNSRLDCEYSSWHEGTVVRVSNQTVTINITKDLLRHAPVKSFVVKQPLIGIMPLKTGDLVLVNYWTKPKKIDWTKFPNSMGWGPKLMGRINKRNKLIECGGSVYQQSMLGWFYFIGRWDARVTAKNTDPHGVYQWFAELPGGKQILLYDEKSHKGVYTEKPDR